MDLNPYIGLCLIVISNTPILNNINSGVFLFMLKITYKSVICQQSILIYMNLLIIFNQLLSFPSLSPCN